MLCVPWRTLAGWSCEPGELSRIGPVTAGVARDLALAAAADVTCEWTVIVVGRSGRAVAVAKVRRLRAGGRARSRGAASAAAGGNGDVGVVGRITLTIPAGLFHPAGGPAETEPAGSGPLAAVLAAALRAGESAFSARGSRTAAGGCSHEEASCGYRVPDPMCALVEARDQTCGFPPAVSLPGDASRTIRSPTAWVARPVRVICRLNAAGTTISSTCRAGGSTSPVRGFSPGLPRPG